MKIKNLRPNAIYIGYKGIRPGFTLQAGQIGPSNPLNPAMANHPHIKRDVDKGYIELIMSDSDNRTLGTKPKKAVKEEPKVEEPVVVEEPEVVEPEPVEEEPVVAEEPEPVVEEEPPADELEEPADEPEEEVVEEEEAFSLPKAPSKMNKGDWLKVAYTEPLNMQNEVDAGMTAAKIREAVEARIKELDLL